MPCPHEDTTLECPFCGGAVDLDTHTCARCHEAVAFIRRCVHCEMDVTAFWPYTEDYAKSHPAAFGLLTSPRREVHRV